MSLSDAIYGTSARNAATRACSAKGCILPYATSVRTREYGTLDVCNEHRRILSDAGEVVSEPASHFTTAPTQRTYACPPPTPTRSASHSRRPITRKPGELPAWALPEPKGWAETDADPVVLTATATAEPSDEAPAVVDSIATASSADAMSPTSTPDPVVSGAVLQDGDSAQDAPAASPATLDNDCDDDPPSPESPMTATPPPPSTTTATTPDPVVAVCPLPPDAP